MKAYSSQVMQSSGAIHTLIKMITSRIYSMDISMLHEMGITHHIENTDDVPLSGWIEMQTVPSVEMA